MYMDRIKHSEITVAAYSCMIIIMLLSSCNSNETWREPRSWDETVFAIPDSMRTSEQRELMKNIRCYEKSDGILWYEHGKAVVKEDIELLSSLGISPLYVPFIEQASNQNLEGFYASIAGTMQDAIERGGVLLYDGGLGFRFVKSDSALKEALKDTTWHVHTGSLESLIDSMMTSTAHDGAILK